MPHDFRVLNPSILLGDLGLEEQLELTVSRGFSAIELWWPFVYSDPSIAEQDKFLSAVDSSGLQLVSLNLFEGGMADGHRGLVSRLDTAREIESSLSVARRILEQTGCRNLNVLHGNLLETEEEGAQRDRAARRLGEISDSLADIDVTVLVEQLSNIDSYGIRTVAELLDCLALARSYCREGAIAIQFDFFHLARTGVDLEQLLETHVADVGHIQVADMPERGGPGTGTLPLERILATIERLGYRGEIALEYSHFVDDPFEWMEAWRHR